MRADYILKSESIFTSLDDTPVSGGVVIKGNKIVGVFSENELDKYVGEDTKTTDYGERLIMPGFIDSHTHTGLAMDYIDETYCVDISSAHNFHDIMMIMKGFGDMYPDNKVVFGVNFNFFNLDEYFVPTAKSMDEYFPDRAALIMTWDVHTFFANTKAIEMAGFTKDTPDPNNAMGKDEYGELNGTFNDTAAFALQKIIERPMEERKSSLINFMNKLNQSGITTVADLYPCGVTVPYPLFKAMEDKLTMRIHFYPELLSATPEAAEEYKKDYNSQMLQFSGFKNLIDGSLTGHTAWMLKPYENNPKTKGFPAVPKEKVRAKMLELIGMGVAVRIHCVGDQAIRYVLDVFEEAKKLYGDFKERHNIEHVEWIDPADVPRFAELGVIANMHLRHPIFYIDDAEDYLGEERAKHCSSWRSIYDTGAAMGTGSDFPVVHYNPMLGIHAGVTRTRDDGYPENGWIPEQKLTLPEVLKMYTYGSAYALKRDNDLGTLEAGKLADVIVLDRDLFKVPSREILETKPVMTMMDGKIVYEA